MATDTMRVPVIIPVESGVRRDLTNVMRRIVARAVASGVLHANALFRRALVSSFLIVALGMMLGA